MSLDLEAARSLRLKELAKTKSQNERCESRSAYWADLNDREAREHANDPWNAQHKLRDEFERQSHDVKAAQRAAGDAEFAKFLASRPASAPAPRMDRLGCDEFFYWKKAQAQKEFEAKIRRKVKLELTKELLATRFAGSKGTLVSWGTATAADHVAHMETLLRQAGDSAVVAKKHSAAIDLLSKHQVGTLNEIRKTTAKKSA